MRNISDISFRQNQNTHFMFNNVFPKIVPFMRQSGKACYTLHTLRRRSKYHSAWCVNARIVSRKEINGDHPAHYYNYLPAHYYYFRPSNPITYIRLTEAQDREGGKQTLFRTSRKVSCMNKERKSANLTRPSS
jgi:hypothetical protein